GPVAEEVAAVAARCGASEVHMAAGVTAYAHRRAERLRGAPGPRGVALRVHDAVVTAVPPGAVTPSVAGHYAAFLPYFRRWSGPPVGPARPAPRAVPVP